MWALSLPFFLILLLFLTDNEHILYGLRGTYLQGKGKPDIDDIELFDLSTVKAGVHEPFAEALEPGALDEAALSYMDSLETTAYLVWYKDTLRYERYSMGYDRSTLSNSFSMAKSFTSLAVGAAHDQGLIDPEDFVYEYLPRFNEGQSKKLKVKHLLQMRSNIDFGESYSNPFGYQAKAYYGKDLQGITEPYRASSEPGTLWKYEGGNTLLLAEILKKTTNKQVSQWFQDYFWSKIGTEKDAFWNLDIAGGDEKAFSGFYATARDFGRIGHLMLHNGNWKGKQLISEEWINASIQPHGTPNEEGEDILHYGYQWWLAMPDEDPWHFQARGMRGQYIVVIPEKELVIVRLGHARDEVKTTRNMTQDLKRWVDFGLTFAD